MMLRREVTMKKQRLIGLLAVLLSATAFTYAFMLWQMELAASSNNSVTSG